MEIDRYLLTECPYYLFFAMALYFMLRLGQDGARGKSEWFFALSVLGALLFRANILLFIVFAFLYWLLLRKFTLRDLLRRALILSLVLGLFLVPWTIRNARLFHAFIPVTYGAGNPVFEGSYQGENPPTDKEIDDLYGGYDVYAELAAERPDLLDETGKVYDPAMQQYVGQLVNTRLGQVRLQGWWKLRPLGLLKSYLYIKPRVMLNWVWYYIEVLGIRMQTAHRLRQLGFCACLAAVLLARRRFRLEIRFLFGTYLVSLLILALGVACDRYAQMLMPYRYLVMGLGLELLAQRLDGLLKRDRPPIKTVP